MKSTLTIFGGFVGILFFEGFARLIISFYHRMEFQFYGISHLPSDVWMYVLLASVLTSTWLITMVVLTVINKKLKFYSILFAGIILGWRGVEIANSYNSEPAWYFTTVCALHITGVTLAYLLYNQQQKIIKAQESIDLE